jgi:hypothetical protein
MSIPSLRRSLALATTLGLGTAVAVLTSSGPALAAPAPAATIAPVAAPAPHTAQNAAYPGFCFAGQAAVTAGNFGEASAQGALTILIRNTGTTACTLFGYPAVQFTLSDGSTLPAQPTLAGYLGGLWSGGSEPDVTLQPGQTASAMTEATNALNGDISCGYGYPETSHVTVTLPYDTRSTVLPFGSAYCGRPEVHPIVPGTTGDD